MSYGSKIVLFIILMICVAYDLSRCVKPAGAETATYYHDFFHGKRSASGERFSQYKMTAAHNALPLGTIVEVSRGGRKIRVKITDRSGMGRRHIDLSKAAFKKLAPLSRGAIKVEVKVIKYPVKKK